MTDPVQPLTPPTPLPVPRLTLRGAADLVVAVPYLLGFRPEESLVAVSLRGERRQVGVTVRVDLPRAGADGATRPGTQVAAAVALRRQLGVLLARDGARAVLLACYSTDEARGRRLLSTFLPSVGRAAVPVIEAVLCTGERYWSLVCSDPRCCPPDGLPLPDGGLLAAQFVGAGVGLLPDRAALAALLGPAPQREVAAVGRAWRRLRAEPGRDADALVAEVAALAAARAPGSRPTAPLSAAAVARVAVALNDTQVRDRLLTDVPAAPGGPAELAGLAAVLQEVCRRSPEPLVAGVAAATGWVAWRSGTGALASLAVDRALAADPEHRLAVLLGHLLAAGVAPPCYPRLPGRSGPVRADDGCPAAPSVGEPPQPA